MTNVNSPFGGRPINTLTATDFTAKTHVYSSATADGTKIYTNDFVKLYGGANSRGVLYARQATAGDTLVGVVVAIKNFINNETHIFRAANTELDLYVIDDPFAEYEVQVNGTITAADIGKEANLIVAPGNDYIGVSAIQIDATTIGMTGGQVKILGVIERDDNSIGQYTKVRCVIIDHAHTIDDFWVRSAGTVSPRIPTDNVAIGGNLDVTGKLTVDGLIDPTGLTVTPQATPPSTANGTHYYDSTTNSFKFRADGQWKSLPQTINVINVAADFPTHAAVYSGYQASIGANVTDNDPTKTNTGQSFLAGQDIFWNGTNYTTHSGDTYWGDNGTDLSPVSPRNINLTSSGLKDSNVTTAVKLGDGTHTSFSTTNKTIIGAANEIKTAVDLKATDSTVVHNTGNETVAGIKTLSSAPIFDSLTASRAAYIDSNKKPASSATTDVELGYVSGVTSSIQTQIDSKAPVFTTGNLTSATLTVGGGTNAIIGAGTTIEAPAATTSTTGIVQLSNSYTGTLQTKAVTEKALKDGLASVTPGSDLWEYVISYNYLKPANDGYGVASLTNFQLKFDGDHTESTLDRSNVMTTWDNLFPTDYVVGHADISHGYYNSAATSYVFSNNGLSGMTSGYVRSYSIGSVYDYSYYEESSSAAKTIPAVTLYHGYINSDEITGFALYKSNLNFLDASGGVIIGFPQGTAAISRFGWLGLANSDLSYVDCLATGIADFVQTGCIRFMLIPDYSGTPAGITPTFFAISKAANDSDNLITLKHSAVDGSLLLNIKDQNGVDIVAPASATAWSPIAGTTYEIAIDVDLSTGKTRIFINGTLYATYTDIGTRTSAVALLRIGSDYQAANSSNFYISNFTIYNAPQFPLTVLAYTPGYYLESIYNKKWYEAGVDKYQTISQHAFSDLVIGTIDLSTYGTLHAAKPASLNQLSRTSTALGGMGYEQVPLFTLHGQYDPQTDKFLFKSDGTNAWGQVITSASTGLQIYKFTVASAFDYTVAASLVLISANLQHSL